MRTFKQLVTPRWGIVALLVSVGLAISVAPARKPPKGCTPGTYACTGDAKGWMVCNTSRQFVFAGVCPPTTGCRYFPPHVGATPSLSPYCVPPDFKIP